jgi:hypothetical protein
VYSPPHAGLFKASNGTVLSCIYLGAANLKVIDISSIVSVVAIFHMTLFPLAMEISRSDILWQKSQDWMPQCLEASMKTRRSKMETKNRCQHRIDDL